MKVWQDHSGHNLTLQGDGFYISYLVPYAMSLRYGWGASDDESTGETALCRKDLSTFKILNGDFRKQYEEIIDGGYDACLAFFNAQDVKSSWSD